MYVFLLVAVNVFMLTKKNYIPLLTHVSHNKVAHQSVTFFYRSFHRPFTKGEQGDGGELSFCVIAAMLFNVDHIAVSIFAGYD